MVDDVGNLHKNTLKKELLKYIYPKSQKRDYNKIQIKALCDELFMKLEKFGYLVESHPKNASGSESVRSSYQVGPKFEQAVEDYFQTKKKIPTTTSMEPIELEDSDPDIPVSQEANSEYKKLEKEKVEPLLIKRKSGLLYQLFLLFKLNERGEYEAALEQGAKFIFNFFSQLYRDYLSSTGGGIFNSTTLRQFISQLSIEGYIPFFDSEIDELVHTSQELASQHTNPKEQALELFELLSQF
jgi:hypothetical protein